MNCSFILKPSLQQRSQYSPIYIAGFTWIVPTSCVGMQPLTLHHSIGCCWGFFSSLVCITIDSCVTVDPVIFQPLLLELVNLSVSSQYSVSASNALADLLCDHSLYRPIANFLTSPQACQSTETPGQFEIGKYMYMHVV